MQTVTLDPGLLRRELSLEEATLSPDGQAGHSETWTEIAVVFAHVESVGARERFHSNRQVQETTHRITTRYRPDIVAGMRFVNLGRQFKIHAVHDPDDSARYLVCMTAEIRP